MLCDGIWVGAALMSTLWPSVPSKAVAEEHHTDTSHFTIIALSDIGYRRVTWGTAHHFRQTPAILSLSFTSAETEHRSIA